MDVKRREEVTSFVDISMLRSSIDISILSVSTWGDARRRPTIPYKLNFFSCNSIFAFHFWKQKPFELQHGAIIQMTLTKNGKNNNNKKKVLHGKKVMWQIKSSKHFKQHRRTRILVFRYIFCWYDKRNTQHLIVDKKAQTGHKFLFLNWCLHQVTVC